MKNADMPAMPLDSQAEGDIRLGYGYEHQGLTKREHFAAMAMQGILACHEKCKYKDVAVASTRFADALLVELECTDD